MKKKQKWFCEGTVPGKELGKIEHRFLIDKVIYKGKSPYQEILIFDSPLYGRILVLDDILQLSEKDEYIYHEMITHPVLFFHPDPQKVLIIGGGDGGALREVLKHEVKEVYLVDIDEKVIELSKKYLPFVSKGAFEDKRTKIFIEDGQKFIKNYQDFFDIVIVDSSDPMGPSLPLYSQKFYRDVFKALTEKGIVQVQVGSFLDFEDLVKKTFSRLRRIFPEVKIFRLTIPSFHCGEYCFIGASKKISFDRIDFAKIGEKFQKMVKKGVVFNYYSPEIHKASMVLPRKWQIEK